MLPPELDPRIGRPRPRRQGLRRALALLTVTLSVLIVVASTGGYVVVRWFNGSIARIQLNFGGDRPPEAEKGEQNWVLAGLDSRAGTGDEYGGTKEVQGERSDTTILAHLDADGTTTLMSIPRDTLVTIPAYTDDKNVDHPAHQDKFNSAIMLGGPSLMVRTIEAFTGIRVDHYMAVDLAGFKRITDAIGGVDVCVKQSSLVERSTDDAGNSVRSTNLDDPYSGWRGQVGNNHLNGDQALAFVRQRHGLEGGDTARIRRQQQFLGQVFRQSTATGVLLNPGRVSSLIAAVRDALTLDQNTSLTDLEKLAGRMRGLDAAKLRFETVPTRDLTEDDPNTAVISGTRQYKEPGAPRYVGAVQLVLQPQYDQLLARLKGEPVSSPTPTVEPPAPVTVPPSQVLVTVENGTTTSGEARRATEALSGLGFRTNSPQVADGSTYGASEVRYAPGLDDSAKTVSAAVPGSVLKVDPTVQNGIVLVVGSSYTGVRPVSVLGSTPSATPTPTRSATPSASAAAPPPVTAADAGNRCTF